MSPGFAITFLWAAWFLSWIAAAAWSGHTQKRPPFGHEILYRILTIIGVLMLFGFYSPRHFAPTQIWHLSEGAGWFMATLTAAGFAFCWWARIHLGRLWSGNITRKEGHRIIDTGPYAFVRHPIYTGIILASFATAIEKGTAVALTGAAVMTIGWYIKARIEERFLREELGAADYDSYAHRVAMLVPFVKI
ncbi:MAG TPA: isoprenylcysteine carboxylmethyltransferase family protein [Rhizomicrobium sp.]